MFILIHQCVSHLGIPEEVFEVVRVEKPPRCLKSFERP